MFVGLLNRKKKGTSNNCITVAIWNYFRYYLGGVILKTKATDIQIVTHWEKLSLIKKRIACSQNAWLASNSQYFTSMALREMHIA